MHETYYWNIESIPDCQEMKWEYIRTFWSWGVEVD